MFVFLDILICSLAVLKSCIEASEDAWSPSNLAAPVEVMMT